MRKLGHIYCPTGEWTHASTPTHMHLGGDYYRIFYASRDRQNRGHIFSLDIDTNHPLKPENIRGPLLSPGRKGTFDDCGLSPSCVDNGVLYYLGWSLTKTAPFSNWIGSCSVNDWGLERTGEAPVLGRSDEDPISVSYPWVDGDTMYYSSNLAWGYSGDDMTFVMKTGWMDSHGWYGSKDEVIPLLPGERALVRPTMDLLGDTMWYAIKTDKYRIGNAVRDGEGWTRVDDCPLKPSEGFDSEEVTYPCVFKHGDKTYMLYNGNGYGKTGFGIAVAG